MLRDVAGVACCLFCDSYFVITVLTVELSQFSGKEGKALLQKKLEKLQNKYQNEFPFLRCPTCTEIITGKKYTEWLTSDEECVIVVGKFVEFEGEIPFYLDYGENKPKWTRVIGDYGPQTLELDNSKSGRLFKKQLAPYGIKSPLYTPSMSKEDHLYIVNTTIQAIKRKGEVDLQTMQQLLNDLWKLKPLYVNWNEVAADLESYACELDFSSFNT